MDESLRLRFPLYDSRFEHDACGVGFVARISGVHGHDIVRKAVTSVCNLSHRGAVAADTQTGDGAGILTQLPLKFFLSDVSGLASKMEKDHDLGVGMIFMPADDEDAYSLCKALVEHAVTARGLGLFGWRSVPVDLTAIGDSAALTAPKIQQVLLRKPRHVSPAEFERLKDIDDRAQGLRKAMDFFKLLDFLFQCGNSFAHIVSLSPSPAQWDIPFPPEEWGPSLSAMLPGGDAGLTPLQRVFGSPIRLD